MTADRPIHRTSPKIHSPKFAVAILARRVLVRGNKTGPRRMFSSGSGVVVAIVARIGYEQLRLATLTTSENFIKVKFRKSGYCELPRALQVQTKPRNLGYSSWIHRLLLSLHHEAGNKLRGAYR
jgi:hypothetical protein